MDGIQQCSVSASGREAENGSSKDDSELDDVAIKHLTRQRQARVGLLKRVSAVPKLPALALTDSTGGPS